MIIGYLVHTCCHSTCGISYAVPKVWDDQKRNDYSTMYCPNGHPQNYKRGTSAEDKLRRENERLTQNRAYLEDQIREREASLEQERKKSTAYKGHVTRIKNRVSAGVCPCCNRTFQDLARHMAGKHPHYKKKEEAA